jgi:hypothetical protein
MTSTAKATSKTKTSAPAKTGRQTSVAPAAKAQETSQAQQQAAEAPTSRKFESSDALAHYIQHNPEFGTRPLDEQNELRTQLVQAKRVEAVG